MALTGGHVAGVSLGHTADHNLIDAALTALPSIYAPKATTPVWTTLTLVNGWTNIGAPFSPAGFWKDIAGIVHFRGMLVPPGVAPVVGDRLATGLPVGSRPLEERLSSCRSDSGTAQIRFKNDVGIYYFGPAVGGWLSLSDLNFPAEA